MKDSYKITEDINFSLKAVKKPLFGGNKNKKVRFFFETEFYEDKFIIEENNNYSHEPAITFYFNKKLFKKLVHNFDDIVDL